MSPVTFKFFSPRGDCRRVTYEETPEFATINETVDRMVEGRRTLTYRDSEGDIVLLKTSRDVLEAVNDAQDAGVKSIKVRINMVRECPHKNASKATAANNNNNNNNSNNRNHCGSSASRRANCRRAGAPQWGRCWSRGLFGLPHHINVDDVEGVSNEVEEIIKHFAPFFGINLDTHAAEKENQTEASGEPASGGENHPSNESEQSKEAAKEVEETPKQAAAVAVTTPAPTIEEAKEGTEETPKQAEAVAVTTPAPTIEEATEPVSGSDYTFVENEPEVDPTEEGPAPQREPKKKAEDSAVDEPKPDAIDGKLKLLKEMGFELPQDVARNMIRELNGRMDLIVRALVANQK